MDKTGLPSIYNFPPLYTRQPNSLTYNAQLDSWATILTEFASANKIWSMNKQGQAISYGPYSEDEQTPVSSISIFENTEIERSCKPDFINDIWNHLVAGNFAFSDSQDVYYITWLHPESLGSNILEWCEQTANLDKILTLYELISEPGTAFTGVHPEILTKALQVLVGRKRATLLMDGKAVAGVKIV